MWKHPRSNDETQIVRSADQARQGVTGHGVRHVLLIGLLGVIIAFVILLAG